MKRISPGAVALVRALLTLDDDADVPTAQEDVSPEDQLGAAALITSLFIHAVRRLFPEGASRGEVIRFVAELRLNLPSDTSIDTRATEGMIMSVLDAKRREEIPQEVAAASAVAIVQHLLDQARIGTDELEAVLAKAIASTEEYGLDAQLRVEDAYGSQA
ncbi:hypothetical protein O7608_06770 [Solwaraspora sp. WMMA2056]|uniref:hypothetical protein n=1 Tax=Solwaraspora sp. WMMA2056 TaxID=3015161 RepID=UPI00259BEE77|nr:hypothetical protein [Solwaraspora sp. WMMA2056]WJK42089.1 hypothetical protein O7608_06770 [Solwaraspora sp. WMMA2056]